VFSRDVFKTENRAAGCGNCTVKAASGRVSTIIPAGLGRHFFFCSDVSWSGIGKWSTISGEKNYTYLKAVVPRHSSGG
jgi:hypothetical protein